MALPRKKKGDFATLLDEPPEDPALAEAPPEDDFEDDLSALDEEEAPTDEMAEGDEFEEDTEPSIDPEHAALARRLGFTEPDQQQALVDLIKLVASPEPGSSTDASSDLPPLPESIY